MAGEGDVLLLSPGHYFMPDEASLICRSIRVIGMGMQQQVWTIWGDISYVMTSTYATTLSAPSIHPHDRMLSFTITLMTTASSAAAGAMWSLRILA